MYSPSRLVASLNLFPDLAAQLVEVKCGEYCSCDKFENQTCHSGEAIQIESRMSAITFIALWSEGTVPDVSGLQDILVLPLGESASELRRNFADAQRLGGRRFGIGPDFVNLEPDEWPIHAEIFRLTYFGYYDVAEEILPLPESIHGYIQEVNLVFESLQPPYRCPICHVDSCDATSNRESPCTYTEEL